MSEWLLIFNVDSNGGYGGRVANVTMQRFSTRELCESAARQTIKLLDTSPAMAVGGSISYKCFHQVNGEWVEGEAK